MLAKKPPQAIEQFASFLLIVDCLSWFVCICHVFVFNIVSDIQSIKQLCYLQLRTTMTVRTNSGLAAESEQGTLQELVIDLIVCRHRSSWHVTTAVAVGVTVAILTRSHWAEVTVHHTPTHVQSETDQTLLQGDHALSVDNHGLTMEYHGTPGSPFGEYHADSRTGSLYPLVSILQTRHKSHCFSIGHCVVELCIFVIIKYVYITDMLSFLFK